MLCKKTTCDNNNKNKQTNLILKRWLRLLLKKINSSSTPIFEIR